MACDVQHSPPSLLLLLLSLLVLQGTPILMLRYLLAWMLHVLPEVAINCAWPMTCSTAPRE
jgi:hypothetical protein